MTNQTYKVLAIDDEPNNLQMINQILKDTYSLAFCSVSTDAIAAVIKHIPDIILLDVMMPDINGYDICRRLKEDERTRSIPVIFITAMGEIENETRGFEVGAVDYITKPISPPILKARLETHLALHNQNRELELKVNLRTKELNETRLKVIQRLGRAAEFKDNETGFHVIRMSNFAKIIAVNAGLDDKMADMVLNAAPMHDIGKIGIPDQILQKPGSLDKIEWNQMKQHPHIGANIIGLDESELLQLAAKISLAHHEKFDGTGYPQGLKKEQIPFVGRIIAIADVFDALTTKRPYKEAWSVDRAVDLIQKEAGSHFDPELVQVFLSHLAAILEVKNQWAEDEITER